MPMYTLNFPRCERRDQLQKPFERSPGVLCIHSYILNDNAARES